MNCVKRFGIVVECTVSSMSAQVDMRALLSHANSDLSMGSTRGPR